MRRSHPEVRGLVPRRRDEEGRGRLSRHADRGGSTRSLRSSNLPLRSLPILGRRAFRRRPWSLRRRDRRAMLLVSSTWTKPADSRASVDRIPMQRLPKGTDGLHRRTFQKTSSISSLLSLLLSLTRGHQQPLVSRASSRVTPSRLRTFLLCSNPRSPRRISSKSTTRSTPPRWTPSS